MFFRLPFVSSAVLYYSWLLEVVTAPSDCYVKERKAQQGYLPSVVYLSSVIKAGRSTVHIFSVLLVLNKDLPEHTYTPRSYPSAREGGVFTAKT